MEKRKSLFSLASNFAIRGNILFINPTYHLVNCYHVYGLTFLLSKINSFVALITSKLIIIHPIPCEAPTISITDGAVTSDGYNRAGTKTSLLIRKILPEQENSPGSGKFLPEQENFSRK